MKEKRWYVVKKPSRKYAAHVFLGPKQCKSFIKSEKLPYKSFDTREEAIAYAGCKESKIFFHAPLSLPEKICLVCEKPFKGKTKLCPTCNKLRGGMSVTTAVALKTAFPEQDIFQSKEETPHIASLLYLQTTKAERVKMRKERREFLNSPEYTESRYEKTNILVPDYISRIFEHDLTKELLYLDGDRLNPFVYFLCRKCGKELCQSYENLKLKVGHNCAAEKPSGEVIVEAFLKENGIPFKTQFDTLKCVNPKTNKQMPYDFELFAHRIIIEVQGEQHLKYIPYFHGSEENFHYQVWKDIYKKDFAEKEGYSVLYITYQDIQAGLHGTKIKELISFV